jgi:glucosamine--fructose-6-phosphate aminotransferase (isomerizing)
MCGIVGIAGTRDVAPVILEALKRLEYRGYDSAGIATLQEGEICRRRSPGKLNKLGVVLENKPLGGHTGIGHTRWATHGAPTENNAHPHATGRVAIVHNGIIENFRELKAELEAKGHKFESETDSEVAAHLVTELLSQGLSPDDAAKQAVARLTGAYSIAMIFKDHEGLLIGARKGAPLAVGHGEAEAYIGSDAFALAPFTNRVTYLEDGDVVVIRGPNVSIFDEQGRPANRELKITTASAALVDKAGHNHFMAKEIHEQPEVVGHTLAHYLDPAGPVVRKLGVGLRPALAKASRLTISACGTSFYAGMVGKYWFEKLARLAVEIDVSSELRYRDPVWPEHGAALFISQSGETADTLAALRDAKVNGQTTIAVVNVSESSIAREADIVLPTYAGPEIGVASTKAFTCQLAALASFAIAAGVARGNLSAEDEKKLCASLLETPRHIADFLKQELKIKAVAEEVAKARDVLYMGRGASFPLAMEGALKLKEISYIHAEGYAAGEMKHGPIAHRHRPP